MPFAHHQKIVGSAAFSGAREFTDDAAGDPPFAPEFLAQALARERSRGQLYDAEVAQTDVLGATQPDVARGAQERRSAG